MKALVVVDVQNDFCPGGTLAVPEGDRVVEPLNCMIDFALKLGLPVVASRDWHPRNSRHFAEFGGKWPVHCVRETHGAEFHPKLKLPKSTIIVSKGLASDGADRWVSGYSAFDGVIEPESRSKESRASTLQELLFEQEIDTILVGGLATDYCVKATVLDARRLGFEVVVLEKAIRGVEMNPGDTARAIEEMRNAGAQFLSFPEP